MRDVLHWYCVRDGTVFIYELGYDGLPVSLGFNWGNSYTASNIVHIDKNPDFDDLRNYVVVLALQKIPEGQGTDIVSVPTFPLLEARTKETTPNIPWAKCLVQALQGTLSPDQLAVIADNLSKMSTTYEVTGRVTIPGNAQIKPYDLWDDSVIYSVTHNIDLQAKTFTTDLEFMRKTT